MPLSTAVAVENALATGLRGSTGLVTDPLKQAGATPLTVFQAITGSTQVVGNSSTIENITSYNTLNFPITIAPGPVHTDALSRILHGVLGAGVQSSEGTAYKWTFTGIGTPWEQVVLERYKTSAASTAKFEYCYCNSWTGQTTRNSYVQQGFGYTAAKMTTAVANPSLTQSNLAKVVKFSNAVASLTVFTVATIDWTPYVNSISWNFSRAVNVRDANISTFPNSTLTDPDAAASFVITCTGVENSIMAPSYTLQSQAQGGSLNPATTSAQAVVLTFVGGTTTSDITKYHTLKIEGNFVQSTGTNPDGTNNTTLTLEDSLVVTVINDVAAIARPT